MSMTPTIELGGVYRALDQVGQYPHLRYMGSKYRLIPALADVFHQLGGSTALDPFCGSGVVSYLLKAQGYAVTSGDYLNFPVTLAGAACVNQDQQITDAAVAGVVSGENLDGRDFISRTYAGRFFTDDDLRFLDSAWSQIAVLTGAQQDIAVAALVLAAARKQPRGVFTVTGLRYDDGRAQLHTPLSEQFLTCVDAWNGAVFAGEPCAAAQGEVADAAPGTDVVYLDPPYAPPRDDNDYLKRYWFLEGLSNYWENGNAEIMQDTLTRKLAKRPTPFGSKRTIMRALAETFDKFRSSSLVLSYGSNAIPSVEDIVAMLREVKGSTPEVVSLAHRYHFGTHASATRRQAVEYIIISS